MRIAVCLAHVLDATCALAIEERSGAVQQAEPEPIRIVNPPDRAALDLAMGLRADGRGEVVAVTAGPESSREALLYALARGADRAVHILDMGGALRWPAALAAALGDFLGRMEADLVLCGDRTLEDGSGQVGPFLAEALGWPQVTSVIDVAWNADSGQMRVERRLARGQRQVVEASLPALLVVDAGAREPPYVSLWSRHRARERPIETYPIPPTVPREERVRLLRIGPPRPRAKRIPIPDKTLSAADRMRQLMAGGTKRVEGKLVEGPPDQAAERIVAFLRERGFIY